MPDTAETAHITAPRSMAHLLRTTLMAVGILSLLLSVVGAALLFQHAFAEQFDTDLSRTVEAIAVGYEHSADPQRPATEATYQSAGKLIGEIANRYNIPLDRTHIVGHKEIKATQCPGTMDIDKLINIAKGGGTVDTQKIIDELRAARDKNWNLYQEELKKSQDLQTKLTACESKPVNTEDSKTLAELRTILKRIIGI